VLLSVLHGRQKQRETASLGSHVLGARTRPTSAPSAAASAHVARSSPSPGATRARCACLPTFRSSRRRRLACGSASRTTLQRAHGHTPGNRRPRQAGQPRRGVASNWSHREAGGLTRPGADSLPPAGAALEESPAAAGVAPAASTRGSGAALRELRQAPAPQPQPSARRPRAAPRIVRSCSGFVHLSPCCQERQASPRPAHQARSRPLQPLEHQRQWRGSAAGVTAQVRQLSVVGSCAPTRGPCGPSAAATT